MPEKWINQINTKNSNIALNLHDSRITGLNSFTSTEGINNQNLQEDDSYIPTSNFLYNQANVTIAGITIGTVANASPGNRVITTSALKAALGLSNSVYFRGTTNINITDGSSNIPTDIYGSEGAPSIGDIIIDKNNNYEYIWVVKNNNGFWEQFGHYQIASKQNYGQVLIKDEPNNAIIVEDGAISVPYISDAGSITSSSTGLPTGSAIYNYISQHTSISPNFEKAIISITRNGTNFNYETLDHTTGSFNQYWEPASTSSGGYVTQLPTTTGEYYLSGDNTWKIYNPGITESSADNKYVKKTGDTMTGTLSYYRNEFIRGQSTTASTSGSTPAIIFADQEGQQMARIDCSYTASSTSTSTSEPGYMSLNLNIFKNTSAASAKRLTIKNYDTNQDMSQWQINWDGYLTAGKVFNAVFNDYAEYRASVEDIQPGRTVYEVGDGTVKMTTERMQRGCMIVSDTFGTVMGQTKNCNTPIAVAGRVLAYCYEDREVAKAHIGYPVCSGPEGTVSIMSPEEEAWFPSRIIGTISEIPEYDTWGTDNIKVNGRIWIKII